MVGNRWRKVHLLRPEVSSSERKASLGAIAVRHAGRRIAHAGWKNMPTGHTLSVLVQEHRRTTVPLPGTDSMFNG